jgi:hypothetical protein
MKSLPKKSKSFGNPANQSPQMLNNLLIRGNLL